MALSSGAPLGVTEGIEDMRLAFVAILVSLAAGLSAAVAGNYCTAWQGSAPPTCAAYGYRLLAFAVLGAAALLFVGGILALAWGPHVPESPEGLYCVNCGLLDLEATRETVVLRTMRSHVPVRHRPRILPA